MSDPRFYNPQAPGAMAPQPFNPLAAPQAFAPMAAAPVAAAPGMDFFIPPEEEVLAAYREAKSKIGQGGGKANYLKFLGPQGETRWTNIHVGHTARVPVYILPAPQAKPGQPQAGISIETKTHFWKSAAHPQGSMIGCMGKEKCLICKAREIGLANQDPQIQKRAKEFGRTRTQYLYQVASLQYPQAHVGEDGRMRPQLLAAGAKLHGAIGELIATFTLMRVVHPQHGRPVMLHKTKTGREERDVEYGAVGLDPCPLPAQFYPLFQALWDLNEFVRNPTIEEQMVTVQDMGLYVPGPVSAAPTAAFNPTPAAGPWPSPYPAPAPAPQQWTQAPAPAPAQGWAPAPQQFAGFQMPQGAPPPVNSGMAPAYTPPGDPYQFPLPAAAPQQFSMPMGPPPVPGELAPPPVSSQPVAGGYQPLPGAPSGFQAPSQAPTLQMPPVWTPQGAGALPPAPPMQTQLGVPSVSPETPRALSVPVQGTLPGSRERCYGKPTPTDNYCQQCPEWIKSQCLMVAGQSGGPGGDQLNQLQAQLAGQVRRRG